MISLFLYLSLAHTNKLSFPCLLIYLDLSLLFVTSSLFLAHSLVIVQQSTSLCMLSKRKPLHFLLCAQFILIDCSVTFSCVQWIIKRSAKLPSCSELQYSTAPYTFLSDVTVKQIMMYVWKTQCIYSFLIWSDFVLPFLTHNGHYCWLASEYFVVWLSNKYPKANWVNKQYRKQLLLASTLRHIQ